MDASGAIQFQTGSIGAEESSSSGMGSGMGDALRSARLRAHLSMADVAAATKIGTDYLEAIESMDRAALPPRAYTLGFVRCYANHLGLDAEEMVCGFKTYFYDGVSPLGDLSHKPAPAWVDFRLPKGTGIMLVIISALALATWYGLRAPSQSLAAVPTVPEALADWAHSSDMSAMPDIAITYVTLDDS